MYLHLLTGAGRCWPDTRIQLSPPHPVLVRGHREGRQDAPVLASRAGRARASPTSWSVRSSRPSRSGGFPGRGAADGARHRGRDGGGRVRRPPRPGLRRRPGGPALVLPRRPPRRSAADLDRMRLSTSWVDDRRRDHPPHPRGHRGPGGRRPDRRPHPPAAGRPGQPRPGGRGRSRRRSRRPAWRAGGLPRRGRALGLPAPGRRPLGPTRHPGTEPAWPNAASAAAWAAWWSGGW